MKNILKLILQSFINPFQILFDIDWKYLLIYIGKTLLLSLQLYCLQFTFLISFILILPLLSKDGYIFSNIYYFIHGYFIGGIKYHIWFYCVCLFISIFSEK